MGRLFQLLSRIIHKRTKVNCLVSMFPSGQECGIIVTALRVCHTSQSLAISSGDWEGCVFLRRNCLKAMARKPNPSVSCIKRNGFQSRFHFDGLSAWDWFKLLDPPSVDPLFDETLRRKYGRRDGPVSKYF
jgi:hypothetical protein